MSLALNAVDRILRKAGKNRVSEGAALELKKILEEKAEEIAKKAHDYAEHAGRVTVKKEDIDLATK